MEDAVAVIPGFMCRTCDNVGGCTAPGSRSSSEIGPVHFFGVYDGHGGSQLKYVSDIIAKTGLLGVKPASTPLEQNHHLALADGPLLDNPQQRLIYLCFT